jgi:hypothetical protein
MTAWGVSNRETQYIVFTALITQFDLDIPGAWQNFNTGVWRMKSEIP